MPNDNINSAESAILAKIAELAAAIPADGSDGFDVQAARTMAYAVNQLAEARAWLRMPNQSHGGSQVVSAS